MKKTLPILLVIAAFSACPLRAADHETVAAKVEERLREIDLSAVFKLYEGVQHEANAVRLKLYTLEAQEEVESPEARDKQIKRLTDQLSRLKMRAQELRASIPKMALKGDPE